VYRTLRTQIADLIHQAIENAQAKGELPPFEIPPLPVERGRRPEHGDYSSSVCMKLAQDAQASPREIAAKVVGHLPPTPFVGKAEVAGPGYINITLDHSWLAAQLRDILAAKENWGNTDVGKGRRVQVEFVSANPTGPLTIGSARNAVIGDALASVLEAGGYEVEREYYVNDAGSQVRKFGESLYARYAQALGRDEPFPEDGYQGQYVVEMGQRMAREHGDRYLNVTRREAVQALGAEGIARVLEGVRRDLADMGVEFDTWFHEKSLYDSGLFDQVLGMVREKGYLVERDGAAWFTFPGLADDAVVIRSAKVIPEPSERPTYFASDIAYVWNKLVERGFDKAIYVWGADHHGDVPRVKAAAQALGLDPERVVIILYQMVHLTRSGEDVRMSKRTGEFVTLRELLDEVGPDPIRFFLLTRTVDATVDFDLDLAVERSDKNPVYYVQYAHARIASILRHAREQGWKLDEPADPALLRHPGELALIRKMLELPEVIEQAATKMNTHLLPFYAQELAATFHAFYRDCRVVSSEPSDADLTRARLELVQGVKAVLARVLHLMGMGAPERM